MDNSQHSAGEATSRGLVRHRIRGAAYPPPRTEYLANRSRRECLTIECLSDRATMDVDEPLDSNGCTTRLRKRTSRLWLFFPAIDTYRPYALYSKVPRRLRSND